MELKKITQEKHEKWLCDEKGVDFKNANLEGVELGGTYLRNADFRGANLRHAGLSAADLRGADFRGADFKDVNLDYSCLPLWCGSLDVHIDEKQTFQLLYHLLRNVSYSKNISEDVKQKLLTPELVELANRFHRAEECGKIMPYRK